MIEATFVAGCCLILSEERGCLLLTSAYSRPSLQKRGTQMSDSLANQPGQTPFEGYVIDAENAAEMARLLLQDQLLTRAMGGPLAEQVDMSQVHRVLDIGCGPGGWVL